MIARGSVARRRSSITVGSVCRPVGSAYGERDERSGEMRASAEDRWAQHEILGNLADRVEELVAVLAEGPDAEAVVSRKFRLDRVDRPQDRSASLPDRPGGSL